MFTNLQEVLSYIEQKTNFQLGIRRVNSFLDKALITYNTLDFIHIGGTNGKGSCSYYLSNILIENGYKTGLFSSPSIDVHNDRIRVNNTYISDEDIINFVNKYYDLIELTELTMFEIDVVMALEYFVNMNVDIVVMEVGMGGLYDGTNIINPLVSVITNIGLDHMTYLGDTYKEIAYNKAGIIKENIPVVCGVTQEDALNVIKGVALEKNSNIIMVNNYSISNYDPITFNYLEYNNITLKTKAKYQIINSCLVLEVINLLIKQYDYKIEIDSIFKVFSTITWPGRFEIVLDKPMILIDGAHNIEGINALIDSLNVFSDKKISVLFSALIDKNTDDMVKLLLDNVNEVILCEFDFYRAKRVEDLNKNFNIETTSDYRRFIDNYCNNNDIDNILVITGSLYFISDIRKYILEEK